MCSVHAGDRELGVNFRVGAFPPRAMAKMDLQPESLQRCPLEGIVAGLALHRFIAHFSIKRNTDLDTIQGLLLVTLEEALPTQELGPEAGSTEMFFLAARSMLRISPKMRSWRSRMRENVSIEKAYLEAGSIALLEGR
jgi:hypothetical protein